jgi:hypothetical protein
MTSMEPSTALAVLMRSLSNAYELAPENVLAFAASVNTMASLEAALEVVESKNRARCDDDQDEHVYYPR